MEQMCKQNGYQFLGLSIDLPLCLEKHPCSGFGAGPSKRNSARPISFIVFAFRTRRPVKCTSGLPERQKCHFVIHISFDVNLMKI